MYWLWCLCAARTCTLKNFQVLLDTSSVVSRLLFIYVEWFEFNSLLWLSLTLQLIGKWYGVCQLFWHTATPEEESANFRPLALKIFKEIEDTGNVQDAVEMHWSVWKWIFLSKFPFNLRLLTICGHVEGEIVCVYIIKKNKGWGL